MKSRVMEKDHADLIRLCKAMTPAERLVAFYHHCRLVNAFHQAGKDSRGKSPPAAARRAKE